MKTKAFIQKLKEEKGSSLMETVMAIGVMSIILSSASFVTKNATSQFTHSEKKVNTTEFASNMASYMRNMNYCSSEILGKALPSTSGANFNLASFEYSRSDVKYTGIATNTEVEKGVRIKSLRWRRVAGAPEIVRREGINFQKFDLSVDMVMGYTLPVEREKTASFVIPVLRDPLTGNLECFQGDSTSQEVACQDAGKRMVAGVCRPMDNCESTSSFIVRTCASTHAAASYTCSDSGHYPQSGDNELTNGTTCPTDTITTNTGRFVDSWTTSCGKKCTATITRTERAYTCMRCN